LIKFIFKAQKEKKKKKTKQAKKNPTKIDQTVNQSDVTQNTSVSGFSLRLHMVKLARGNI